MTWVVAATLVVNVTVATPLPLVREVGLPKDPPPVLDQVTVLPEVATALLFPSASCAVIVTCVPAAGVELDDVTTYLVAAAAAYVTVWLPLVMAAPLTVAPTVPVPLVVGAVSVAVKVLSFTFVTPLSAPVPESETATLVPGTRRFRPFASRARTVIVAALAPSAVMLAAEAWITDREVDAACATVTVAESLAVPAVATMTLLPCATEVTRPVPLTVATPGVREVHVTAGFGAAIESPRALRTLAL